ncbi:CaiB/BaiF CoA transferase family protein [Pseudomonas saliphila]|uniref:CaiB/BaiF CoA transferase family protein n=1 Tax=Pseudomonas saliphila TaxID=2586906 RepID=UPI0012396BC2|nr:CaiB/BaiF CoA-transferase family protein [Pseudomonas saliphila]
MSGPLAGVKVVEIVGLGAAPFCAMMLADMGAQVIRIDRPGGGEIMKLVEPRFDVMARGRRSVAIDLKKPGATEAVLDLVAQADILLEGFRPGVMERMGLGPDTCLARNPKLVYGRMTGWGQDGPLAQAAGHDINYIALAGVLHTIGALGEPPLPPMNLIGDFGGGGMLLAFGILCALHEAGRSGHGQVVDAAMAEGSALLAAMNWGFKAAGLWRNERGSNVNDGGAHFYAAYACADGHCISIASAEPQFYALLRQKLGLDDPAFDAQHDHRRWPELKERLAGIFKTRTRAEWCALLEGSDVCFAPVLDWDEAPGHPHNRARGMFIDIDGVTQPAPAPRFSRSSPPRPSAPSAPGADTETALRDWGFDPGRIDALRASGALPPQPGT